MLALSQHLLVLILLLLLVFRLCVAIGVASMMVLEKLQIPSAGCVFRRSTFVMLCFKAVTFVSLCRSFSLNFSCLCFSLCCYLGGVLGILCGEWPEEVGGIGSNELASTSGAMRR